MSKEKLVHILSNEVSLTDVVNAVLAVGAAAICANDIEEVDEVTGFCDALVLNIGLPSRKKLEVMKLAGKKAKEKKIPVVLDPVGAGATLLRKEMLEEILQNLSLSCIKGNYSEMASLLGKNIRTRGVEAASDILLVGDMKDFSKEHGVILVATGEKNLIVEGDCSTIVEGGSALLKKITGAGCMLGGILGAALAEAEADTYFKKVCEAVIFFNDCARRAEETIFAQKKGLGSFKTYFMDALSERMIYENQ